MTGSPLVFNFFLAPVEFWNGPAIWEVEVAGVPVEEMDWALRTG